jgi:iduronate 2-sulfatase
MGYSIRTGRYRYTEWRDWHSGNVLGLELYDHVEDADETVNLAGHTPMVLTQRDLAAQLGKQFPRIGLQ